MRNQPKSHAAWMLSLTGELRAYVEAEYLHPSRYNRARLVEACVKYVREATIAETAVVVYEQNAAEFFAETGLLAPGKDEPAGYAGPAIEERWRVWRDWIKRKADEAYQRHFKPERRS